jgi:AraC-like DNA-binding protein
MDKEIKAELKASIKSLVTEVKDELSMTITDSAFSSVEMIEKSTNNNIIKDQRYLKEKERLLRINDNINEMINDE